MSLLLGAARAADLFLNTDTATGFLLSGSVWTRYWLMAPVVILAWLAGLYCAQSSPRAAAGCGVWMSGVNFVFVPLAFCSELYGFLTVLNVLFGTPEQAGRHQTAAAHPAGAAGGCDARGAVRRVRRVVPSGVF